MGFDLIDGSGSILNHSTVVQEGGDHEASAARACMAVNEYFLAHFIKTAHVLANDKNCFIVGAGQVLPVPVERGYASGLEVLWVVRKADSVVDPISAKRVLTGLLQVDNDSNLHPSQQR